MVFELLFDMLMSIESQTEMYCGSLAYCFNLKYNKGKLSSRGWKQIKEIKCVYQENSYFYHCACCICPIVVLPELGEKDRPEGGRSRTAILT